MAFFDIFKRSDEERDTIIGEGDTLSDVLLSALIRGETITKDQALSIPAVAGNVDFISSCIASMPIKLYERDGDKVKEVVNDPRVTALNFDTGDTLDGFQLKKALVIDYLMDKGGYCYIKKRRNDIQSLHYVDSERVFIDINTDPIFKDYKISVDGKNYKPFDFIKLLRNTKNGAYGVSIVSELNEALDTAYQTQKYKLNLVKTGGNKKGFLKSERKLGQDEIDKLKAAWRNLYANNKENVVVLNAGIDFKEASNNAVELQLNESIQTLNAQIDNIFHISSDFNDTFKFAIFPIAKAFETAINRELLLEKEKQAFFFEFDVKEIVKANIKDRYEVYKLSKECQMTTINERRRMENLNDIEGGDVIDLGLGSVLYDVKTQTYYTPNTDTTAIAGDNSEGKNEN